MMWFVALIMLAFYGLAICTIGGMVTSGISAGLAMAAGVGEVIVGVIMARVVYRAGQRVR